MTEKLRGVSDTAIALNDMLRIEPPAGTRMYQAEAGKETPGVTDFAHGLIRTFDEAPGAAADYVEGTLIRFDPGIIVTHIARRGLSSDEVNKIGLLAAQLDSDMAFSSFIPPTLQNVDGLIKGLRQTSVYRNPAIQEINELDFQIEESLSSLGVLAKTLREQKPAILQKMKEEKEKLEDLKVTLVTSKTGNLGGGVPIKMFKEEQRPQEEQQAA